MFDKNHNKKATGQFIELTERAFRDKEAYEEWDKIRTMHGVYTERKKGTWMLRPRFPGGKLTPKQFKFFVDLGEKYGDKRVHITTRQDIQLHGLTDETLVEVLKVLDENGYSSRATGGNAARAVIVPPMSGFEEEVFDVTPYSEVITDYILSNNHFMGLPRKYKISLSNNEKNSLYAKIADLGLVAVEKNGIKGFRVYGAGGLGAHSKESILLLDFIDREDVLYLVEAMKNLFENYGDRKVKARARIRYIAIKLGDDEFVRLFREYLNKVYETMELKVKVEDTNIELGEAEEVEVTENVYKSSIKGRYGYYLHPAFGDIDTERGRQIYNALKGLPYEVEIRLTYSQGMVIRNLKGEDIEEIKKLNPKGETAFYNSVACIGSTICNLGVVNSPVLLASINEHFQDKKSVAEVLPALRISGCPNSCGAHPVAKLGFWGRKKNGEDYYNVVARGEFQGKVIKLNQPVGELKAAIIPEFLEKLGSILDKEGKNFDQFMKDGNRLEELIGEYQEE